MSEIVHPASVREARRAAEIEGSAYLGGGTWLLSDASRSPRTLIALDRLALDRIDAGETAVRMGATATFQRLVDAAELPRAIREAAALTASRTLRTMATLGGELGLRPFGSALIPVLIAFRARVKTATARAALDIEEFLSAAGPEGERCPLVLEVAVSGAAVNCGVAALSRTSHSSRRLIVAVSAATGSGAPRDYRVVTGDGRNPARRLPEVEEFLDAGGGGADEGGLSELVARTVVVEADIHASAAYKREIASVLVARLARRLAEEAGR